MKWALMVAVASVVIAAAFLLLPKQSYTPVQSAGSVAMQLNSPLVVVNHGEIERLAGYYDFITPAVERTPYWFAGLYNHQLRAQLDYLFVFGSLDQPQLLMHGTFSAEQIIRQLLIDFAVQEVGTNLYRIDALPVLGETFILFTPNWLAVAPTTKQVEQLVTALATKPSTTPKPWQLYQQGKLVAGFEQTDTMQMFSIDLLLASQQLEVSFRSSGNRNTWFNQLPPDISEHFSVTNTAAQFDAEAIFNGEAFIELLEKSFHN
ncbi:hypothetical protein [Salinibius halmophilus]|uniref:hypothetical protein n=1 Tax=Salinibius halmophilus TaxID=1853216 RepID=UPI00131413A5|nr:hypothetical protein [Salinibius halmophilus]